MVVTSLGWRIAAAVYVLWIGAVLLGVAQHEGVYNKCACEPADAGKPRCLCGPAAVRLDCRADRAGPCSQRMANAVFSSVAVYFVFLAPIIFRILAHVRAFNTPGHVTVLMQRLGLHTVAAFARAAVYLLTGLFVERYSDHLLLHGLIAAVLGYELFAALCETKVDAMHRFVVALYCVLVMALLCASSFGTACYFHTPLESLLGLLVAGLALGPYTVAAQRGWLLLLPRPA